MSTKLSVASIAAAQFKTFTGYRARYIVRDIATFVGAPVIIGVAVAIWAPSVYSLTALLTGVSVFTALLVALLVNVFNFSVKLRRDEGFRPEETIVLNVDELFSNAAWTVLTGLALVVLVVIASVTQTPNCPLAHWVSGVLAGALAYFILNVLMVLSRIWTMHETIKLLPPKKR